MIKTVQEVTEKIQQRSEVTRKIYLEKINQTQLQYPPKIKLPCGNIAHSVAACSSSEKKSLIKPSNKNIGIVSAYNDMLSAHQPYKDYPEQIKDHISDLGGTAQFAGGVPAMCDGVTQGQPGMEISLFSRDVIAMSVGIALSHNVFDAAVYFGVCDKIVPGQLIGALSFGHLPTLFIPSGPMVSGISNSQKAKVRQLFAEGKVDRQTLLENEMQSYHAPGTCTFYGTANTNQMVLEFMGLMLPGSAFVNPDTDIRRALTKKACEKIHDIAQSDQAFGLGHLINEKTIVNAIVAILATGGSTNHTIHLIAIAAAAGIIINWDDMAQLSKCVPLLARVYPNGLADVNHFHAAGGTGFLIKQLLNSGHLHEDVMTIMGKGLTLYTQEPFLETGNIIYQPALSDSLDTEILRPVNTPFSKTGGIRVLQGNLGRCVIKVSAVEEKYHYIKAPAIIFETQQGFIDAFKANQIVEDRIIIVRQQGPSANGMPELHQLTPLLTVLLSRGLKVALITDGRMSGASGKVAAAIQLYPEALKGGNIGKLENGDLIEMDIKNNSLNATVDFENRSSTMTENIKHEKLGADMFARFRQHTTHAEKGASIINE